MRLRKSSSRRAAVACLLLAALAAPGLQALGELRHPHRHPAGHHPVVGGWVGGWALEPFEHARHDDLQIEPARHRELGHCAICGSLRPHGSLAGVAGLAGSRGRPEPAWPAVLPDAGSRPFSPRQPRGPPTV